MLDPDDVPSNMHFDYTIFGKIISKKYDDKMFEAVTYTEVQDVCKKLFNINYIGATIVGDSKPEDLPNIKEIKQLFLSSK